MNEEGMDIDQRSNQHNAAGSPLTIEEIETLLGKIQPEPGVKFFRRMQSAPWLQEKKVDRKRFLPLGSIRWGVYGLAAVLTIMICFLIFPSLSAASARIFRFFSPASSDRQNIQIVVPTPGLEPNYTFTLEQARQSAGFPVRLPSYLPPGLQFDGARYDSLLHSVSLRYASSTGALILNQRFTKSANESSSIGSSAPVVTVQVGEGGGEYVSGGWRLISDTEQPLSDIPPGTPVNLRLYWDPELPQQILRWELGDMTYEIICSSGQSLTEDELIRIAESIQ